MSTDPYKVPDSDLEIHEELPSRPIRGIVFGLIIDLGGTILIVIISIFIHSVILAAGGASQSEIENLVMSPEPR